MKKIYWIYLVSLLSAIVFVSCKKNEARLPIEEKVEIVHYYTISSSSPSPCKITFIASSGLDDIYFNGVNEKTSMLTKDIIHEGVQEYMIKTKSNILDTQAIFSSNDAMEISYTWSANIEGREVKSDELTLSIDGVAQTKNYITVSE